MAKTKEIFTGQMPEGSYFLLNCLAKSLMCQIIECLAAGIYGHEEACLLHFAHLSATNVLAHNSTTNLHS